MKSVTKNIIFGLKMMVNGLKNVFKKTPCGKIVIAICDFGHFYLVRESSLPQAGEISKIVFLNHFSPSF
jgi:hypothetical protein